MMITNNNQENKLIIYTILLNKYDSIFTSLFGKNREQGIKFMNEIAALGGSEKLFLVETSDSMHNTFIKIANAITQKYGLKIK